MKKWQVFLDDNFNGDYRTRAEAREYATWLRSHPACRYRRLFGHGGIVEIRRAW